MLFPIGFYVRLVLAEGILHNEYRFIAILL